MARNLRVIHISTVHTSFDQRIFHRECFSLQRAGYDTHLLVQYDRETATVGGVTLHAIGRPTRVRLGLRVWERISRLLQALVLAHRLNGTIYHLHDPELIPLGLVLKLVLRKRVIFDCHENNVAYIRQKPHLNGLLRMLLQTSMARLEWAAAHNFDVIITADQGVAEIFEARYGARRVVVIHNFPRLDLFPLAKHSNHTFDLVYHGSIPRYHLEVAFAVAEALCRRGVEARWLFFGTCVEIDWARAELDRRGLSRLFYITNERIPHELVAARVQKARIGFIPLPDLPKFQHNIPTKLFEYMALGMPVILSDLAPSRPFVGDGTCAIMVPPDDFEAYADAIVRLLDDPALCEQMGRVGQARTYETLNWDAEAPKLVGLYHDLIGNPTHAVHTDH